MVRAIYGLYLEGHSSGQIVEILTKNDIPTVLGKSEWSASTVLSILKNEKYCGDALCQKTYTPDPLTHKSVENIIRRLSVRATGYWYSKSEKNGSSRRRISGSQSVCARQPPNAVRFSRPRDKQKYAVKVSFPVAVDMIRELMDWSKEESWNIPGIYLADENTIMYDLSTAV